MVVIKRYINTLDKVTEYAGKAFSFLILIILSLQAMEAILRFIFKSPTIWSWEVALLLYGAHFIMGAAWLMSTDSHVKTDILFIKLSKKRQALITMILYPIIFFPFAFIMTWKSINHALFSTLIQETTYTQWAAPLYPLKIVIAIAFILILLQGIATWFRSYLYYTKGDEI